MLCFMEVANSLDYLFEVKSSNSLWKRAFLKQGEEVSFFNELKHNEEYLNTLATWLNDHLTCKVVLHKLDYSSVVYWCQQRNFVCHSFLKLGETDWLNLVSLDYFNCVSCTGPDVLR